VKSFLCKPHRPRAGLDIFYKVDEPDRDRSQKKRRGTLRTTILTQNGGTEGSSPRKSMELLYAFLATSAYRNDVFEMVPCTRKGKQVKVRYLI